MFEFFLNHRRFTRLSCSSLPACFLQWEMRGRASWPVRTLTVSERAILSERASSLCCEPEECSEAFFSRRCNSERKAGGSQCGGAGAGKRSLLCSSSFYLLLWETRGGRIATKEEKQRSSRAENRDNFRKVYPPRETEKQNRSCHTGWGAWSPGDSNPKCKN